MKSHFSTRYVVAATALTLVLALTLTFGVAGAQTTNATNATNETTTPAPTGTDSGTITPATSSPSPTSTPTPSESQSPGRTETETDSPVAVDIDPSVSVGNTTYAQQIDPELNLVEWEYSDGAFRLVFESDRPKRVTITEAVQFEKGSGSGRIVEQRLPIGVTEVTVPVERRAGQAALTMTTDMSIARNSYSFVSTGQAQVERPPISYQSAQLLIAMTAIGAVGITFRVVRKRREDEEKDYERVL